MKVSQLIEALKAMDQDADVSHLWDGGPRTEIEHVYMSKGGYCVTSDFDMVCYNDSARPVSAPTEKEDPYWYTGPNPEPQGG